MRHVVDTASERPESDVPWTEHAIEIGVLFLVVFTPLAFGTVNPWSAAIAETVILAMVALWMLRMVREWELRIAIPPGTLTVALFLALTLLQMVPLPAWLTQGVSPRAVALARDVAEFTGAPLGFVPASLAPYATWQQWMTLLSVGLFFLVIYNTYRTRDQVRRLLWAMLLTTALVSLFGIIQRVAWNGRLYWIGPLAPHAQAFGPFVNRAHFAGLAIVGVSMGLAMMLGLQRAQVRRRLLRSWRDRVRAWNSRDVGPERLIPLLVLIAGGAALVSGSRGGVVSLLAALLAMASLGVRGRAGRRRAALVAAATALILLVAVWIGGDILYGTVERLSAELRDSDESPRVRLWQDAMGLWWDTPVLGTGLASFDVAFQPYRTVRAPVIFTHAESDWIQFLTDTGVIGLILVVATFVLLARALLGQYRSIHAPWERNLALGALVALAGTAVQWMANYNLPVMSNLLYLAAAVAVALPLDEAEDV